MSTNVTHASAKIVTASTVLWSTGENFNGFLLLLTAPANNANSLYLRGERRLRVPVDLKVPVIDGVLCDDSRPWLTTELDPPGAKFCDIWYANDQVKIATGASLFTITADPHTITPPTLTTPAAVLTNPDPDVPLSDTSVLAAALSPTIEQASGTGGSVTIVSTPAQIWGVYFNGMLLQEGAANDYTISGTTITFVSLTVAADDIIMAVYV